MPYHAPRVRGRGWHGAWLLRSHAHAPHGPGEPQHQQRPLARPPASLSTQPACLPMPVADETSEQKPWVTGCGGDGATRGVPGCDRGGPSATGVASSATTCPAHSAPACPEPLSAGTRIWPGGSAAGHAGIGPLRGRALAHCGSPSEYCATTIRPRTAATAAVMTPDLVARAASGLV